MKLVYAIQCSMKVCLYFFIGLLCVTLSANNAFSQNPLPGKIQSENAYDAKVLTNFIRKKRRSNQFRVYTRIGADLVFANQVLLLKNDKSYRYLQSGVRFDNLNYLFGITLPTFTGNRFNIEYSYENRRGFYEAQTGEDIFLNESSFEYSFLSRSLELSFELEAGYSEGYHKFSAGMSEMLIQFNEGSILKMETNKIGYIQFLFSIFADELQQFSINYGVRIGALNNELSWFNPFAGLQYEIGPKRLFPKKIRAQGRRIYMHPRFFVNLQFNYKIYLSPTKGNEIHFQDLPVLRTGLFFAIGLE